MASLLKTASPFCRPRRWLKPHPTVPLSGLTFLVPLLASGRPPELLQTQVGSDAPSSGSQGTWLASAILLNPALSSHCAQGLCSPGT